MKNSIIILVIIVIAAAGGYYFYQSQGLAEPETSPETQKDQTSTSGEPQSNTTFQAPAVYSISMNTGGFSPSNLAIKKGDSVTFKNDDTRNRWPASGMHPTHLLCPGFDSLKSMQTGETYSHTFTEAKECPVHDHLIPSLKGKITVNP